MSTDLSEKIRRTLVELTDVPPPPDLAAKAIRRARRRRRRTVTVAACAAAVVGAAVAVPLALSPAPDPPTVTVPPLGDPRRAVGAYSGIAEQTAGSVQATHSYVLDHATGEYRRIPYDLALPSPDGRRFFVARGDGSGANPIRGGIMDGAGAAVRWVEAYDGGAVRAAWSPDGTTILLTRYPKGGQPELVFVDTATLEAKTRPLPAAAQPNSMGLGLIFTADGKGVGLTRSHSVAEDQPERIDGFQLWDLSLRPVRTVPIEAGAIRTAADLSPDGRRAVLHPPFGASDQPIRVADLGDGRVVAEVPVREVVGWYDDEHLVVRDRAELRVVDLTGAVVRTFDGLPAGAEASQIHLVPGEAF
jgi:hypothetical protein